MDTIGCLSLEATAVDNQLVRSIVQTTPIAVACPTSTVQGNSHL